MAHIVMAYTVVAYIGMAYVFYGLHNTNSVAVTATNTAPATSARTALSLIVMAYTNMVYIVVAYIVMAWPI